MGFRQGGPAGYGLRRQLIDRDQSPKGLLGRGERKSLQTDRVILVPGPENEIEVVRQIYELFVSEGKTEREISEALNGRGILGEYARPWTRSTVHQVLTNPKYIGANIYNRRSFKLKHKRINNPVQMWIWRDGAFAPIVDAVIFEQARRIIESRHHHLSDQDLLERLKELLRLRGRLSGLLIDETDDMPSSSCYSTRFGSLTRAYTLIGWTPDRDFAYVEINRNLRRRHADLIAAILDELLALGATVSVDPRNDLLKINSEYSASLIPIQQLMEYYGKDLTGANLPFNFQLLQCAWSADAIAQILSDYHAALPAGAWPNWVLCNHDQPRVASRVGTMQAAAAAMLLLTLPGTLTLYYGEEIGMTNVPIAPESVQDPAEKNEPGIGTGRDPERTPMQWDSTPLAGFTTGQPWLPIAPDHATANVAGQDRDAHSMLALYRDLIRLRSVHPALIDGKMLSIAAHDNVLRYQRVDANETLLILLNLSHEPVQVDASGIILKSTHGDREGGHIAHCTALRSATVSSSKHNRKRRCPLKDILPAPITSQSRRCWKHQIGATWKIETLAEMM
jgi:hypothetical protein